MSLTGFVLICLFDVLSTPALGDLTADPDPVLKRQIGKMKTARYVNGVLGLAVFLALIAVYLRLVLWFGGRWLLVAALMLMVVRLPEQIRETITGEMTTENSPISVLNYVTTALMIAAIPAIGYAFWAA